MSTRYAALAVGLLSAALAQAQAQAQAQAAPRGTLAVLFENDWFGGTDRNYSNGVRLSYTGAAQRPDRVARWVGDAVTGGDEAASVRRAVALGHAIYTPRDTDTAALLPDQHPYGAYAFAEYAVLTERAGRAQVLALQLGVVGPSAGGEWLQNEAHDLFGAPPVLGWENQIGDEVGVTVSYDRLDAPVADGEAFGLPYDLRPSLGASLGNVRTEARLGLTARIGSDLGDGFGPPRIGAALPGSGAFMRKNVFAWYAFAGVQGRAVAHDIFLDGSFLDDGDPSVDKEPLVADVQLGLAVQLGGAQLAYTVVQRSEAFETQAKPQRFGAVSLSARF